MKTKNPHLVRINCFRMSSVMSASVSFAVGLGLSAGLLLGQTIPNPSFEADTFTVFPGYISDNTLITGWTGAPANRVGLNPSDGSPFADNGAIPDGNNVAFIHANVDDPGNPSSLSTTVSGLTVGTTYKVSFRANARGGQTPNLKVYVDGESWLVPSGMPDGMSARAAGASNPYWYIAFEYEAQAASQTLSVVNDAEGDQTLLVDDFRIAPSSGRWSVDAWWGDADSGVDASFFHTHAYNFGSGANAVINSVTFTGVPGAAPAVPGKFSTTYFTSGPLADAFNLVEGDSAVLANHFVYGGNVPAGAFQSITLSDLTPDLEYILSLYLVAWEDPSLVARWATFSVDDDRLTTNQDLFGNDEGIRISYRYTADASGTKTVRIAPIIPGTTIHVYGFGNREAVSRPVPPIISAQPRGTTVSPGLPVTFSVAASGVPVPSSYQWRFEGVAIPGATEATYSLPAVASANAGLYDVIISSTAGSATSEAARLTVGDVAILNPSFEADSFAVFPGYVSGSAPITGWTALDNHGVNPIADGQSPFANNGVIPHGVQVAFLQGDGALSQTISGFTVGGDYYVHYYENSRGGYSVPSIEVKVGETTVVSAHAVPPVGGGNPYRRVSSEMFVASAASLDLAFVKSNPLGGDSTALIDNVAIIQVPPGTAPSISQAPQPATAYVGTSTSFRAVAQGSLPLQYQWQIDGEPIAGATESTYSIPAVALADEGDYTLVVSNDAGSVTSAVARLSLLETITSLRNTGIDASGAPQPAGAISLFWTFEVNSDSESTDVIVANEGWPIQAGVWLVNTATSKWVGPRATVGDADLAAGLYTYRTSFDLTGRDVDTVLIVGRWAVDDGVVGVYLNGAQVSVPLGGAFTAWTSFTLSSDNTTFLAGVNTLDFEINNGAAGPSGLRVEFTQTSARTLPGVPAGVGVQPQGARVAEGDTVVLQVSATGTLPITYQWRKNGVELPGATSDSLVLSNLTTDDSGNYSVRVSNAWGDAISANAAVIVAYQALPGFFGTGVGSEGQLLPDGAVDPHYTLVHSDDELFPGPDAVVVNDAWPIAPAGPWLVNGPDSKWIAPFADQDTIADPTAGNSEGDYTYRTTFNLTGLDLEKVVLLGGVAVDNELTDVLLNGVSLGITAPGFGGFTPFTITGGFVAGANTLDFLVLNLPVTTNPTGLRVDLQGYLDIAPVQPTVLLEISLTGNTVSIAWSPTAAGQILQWAPAGTGPWTDLPGASSPYTATAGETERFYRVIE